MSAPHSPLCDDPTCGPCAQVRATAAFRGGEHLQPGAVACPVCGHRFDPREGAVRVTEATATKAKSKAPYGDVEYADPGYQGDGKKRYPLDTEDHVRAAWSYINQSKNAGKYSAADLKKVKARVKAAMKRLDIAVSENSVTEALINGKRSFDDIRDLVRRAIRDRMKEKSGDYFCWAYIVDISDTDVVYMDEAGYGAAQRLWQCTYSITGDEVTLGEPEEVARTYAPLDSADDEPATEAQQHAADTVDGRVLEAKGTDSETGGRIFRVQLIAYGDSKNGRRYSESVLRAAAGLYEGAKAYDHHRSTEEMTSGTIQGLVGYYRDAAAGEAGLEADLHLLPSATHAAEALDAALALSAGDPLVGISHDVYARFRPVQENGRRVDEATEITAVNSADIVSHPAAGGRATRAVAGGTNPEDDPAGNRSAGEKAAEESDVPVTLADMLAAFKEASDEQLAEAGLARAKESTETKPDDTKPGQGEKATETGGQPQKTTETGELKASFVGRMMIRSKIEEAGLPVSVIESVTSALPERITEADVDGQIASIKTLLGAFERPGLVPTATTQVTKEAVDKKITRLDAMFDGNFREGYRSLKHAHADFAGSRRLAFDEDENRIILRESIGGGFDSAAKRSAESMTSASWDVVLGDSITRRMIKLYAQPTLQNWRTVVSDVVPVNDFRDQRRERIGGYGLLPTVGQGAPYQPLTSPTDEEAVYAVIKRGGTEDLTLEMIANDDMSAVRNIPRLLGLAAAITLYRFVWDILPTNAATSYDSTALFHTNHANTDTAVLGQSTLSAGRKKMRKQSAYGDSTNVLSIIPRTLVVPSDLEELAFQLSRSAVAIPSSGNSSDIPNIHQNLGVEIIDYYTDTNDWYLVCDPTMCPTIEVGFYQGREEPELFTQADQTVGSMFDADKVTYKIRHIYSGTVLDHRGFYRGTNA